MAKPIWVNTNPSSGSGSGAVNVSGTVHSGRSQRGGVLTFKATGVTDVTPAVVQNGLAEFVTINNISAPKAGGNVTITGKSNSQKLYFTLGSGDIIIVLPTTYTAGGASTTNNTNIAGDPGASAEYDFSMVISIPANTTTNNLTKNIVVTAAGGQQATAILTQVAGDPVLSVSPMTITLDSNGTPVSVTVTSNTNWFVE